jgi:PAS domain-containing protein
VSGLWIEVNELVQAIHDPAVVVEFRAEVLHVVAANDAAAFAFGSPVESILGTGFARFYRPDELVTLEGRIRAVLDTGRPATHEVVRELPTGRFVLESSLTPLPGDRVLGVGHDVSVRAAALERASELERLTGTGTWAWNLRDDSVRWSPELRRVLDLPETIEPGAEAAFDRVHRHDIAGVREMIAAVLDTGRTAEIEYRTAFGDGSERRIVLRAGLVRDADDQPVRLVGTVQDVTERRRLQHREHQASNAARQLDRALKLNDDVVQSLARATLALELGLMEEVESAVRDGTGTVRAIMGELLHSTTAFGGALRSGDLRRRHGSSLPRTPSPGSDPAGCGSPDHPASPAPNADRRRPS